jgi:hypothetical protein
MCVQGWGWGWGHRTNRAVRPRLGLSRPTNNPSPLEGEAGARDGFPFLLAEMGPDAGG